MEEEKKEVNEETNKELTPKEPTPVSRVSGKEGAPLGMEEVDMQTDIQMPRIAILQGLSEMVVDGKGQIGELADSLSKEVFGKEMEIIPLFLFKSRLMFLAGQGAVLMSRNGLTITQASAEYEQYLGKNCDELPESQWQGAEPPKLSMVYNFPCLKVDRLNEFPISLSLMRTSTKTAKTLISLAMMSGEDIFARKYRLSTENTKNDKGTFAIAKIELAGKCTDEEYTIAKGWYKKMRGRGIDINMEEEGMNGA